MPKIAGRDRKCELLESARDLIFTEGATRFTIRRLAERVQISEAAVYRHFSSKEALLLSLIETLFHGWDEGIQEILKSAKSPAERLRQVADFHLDYLLHRQFNPVLLLSDATDPNQKPLKEKLQNIAAALFLAISGLLKEGKKDQTFSDNLDVETAAWAFLGGIQSTVLQWTLTQSSSHLRQKLHKVVAFLIQCFQKTPLGAQKPVRLPAGKNRRTKA